MFFPLGPVGAKAVAVSVIAVISAVNFIGVRQGNTLQVAFTAGKILLIGFIVAVGFGLGEPPAAIISSPAGTPGTGNLLDRFPPRPGRGAFRFRRLAHGDLQL